MTDPEKDEEAIVALIHANRAAYWMRDFDAWARCFRRGPELTRLGWWREGGIIVQDGWQEISERFQREVAEYSEPNPAYARDTPIENLTLRVVGDVAWATFEFHYAQTDLRNQQRGTGPHVSHELRIFERDEGGWKIVLNGILNNDFRLSGQTLLLDPGCRVVFASETALAALADDDDLVIRNGILRIRNHRADQSLQQAVRRAAGAGTSYYPGWAALPIVVDAGEGLPTRVWWVVAQDGLISFSFGAHSVAEDRLAMAAHIFDLSPTQAKLAGLLAEGLALPEIAARMGITHNTARTHLHRVYDKTGVSTQTALVRVLLSTTSPL